MKYIEQLLNGLEPIAPIETGLSARYSKNHTLKAVIFDIYGTLLVSSSGDIDQASASAINLERALQSSNKYR